MVFLFFIARPIYLPPPTIAPPDPALPNSNPGHAGMAVALAVAEALGGGAVEGPHAEEGRRGYMEAQINAIESEAALSVR